MATMDFTSYYQDVSSFIFTIASGLLIMYFIRTFMRNLRLPNGPWGLPFVGYLPFVGNDPLDLYNKLAKKYGEVFSIKLGSQTYIVISSYEMNNEVFVKNSGNFTGIVRDFNVINYIFKADNSMLRDEGESWKAQRRFFASCLQEFGTGKIRTERYVQNEAESLVQILKSREGKPVDFINSYLLRQMAFNVVSSITFGRRFDYDDEKLINFIKLSDELLTVFGNDLVILATFPFIRHLPAHWTGLDKIFQHKVKTFSFLHDLIREHEESFDFNNMVDITDLYLKKQLELRAKGIDVDKTSFARENILHNIAFLAMAAMEDGSVALLWILKLAAKFPEVQTKLQQEVDRVVGKQRLPSWSDKSKLPYVDAFLLEAVRFASCLPVSSPHTNYEEVTINGYNFPKRSVVLSHFWNIHHDPKIWGDPENFRPERFLGDDGNIINKLRDRVIGFGLGGRSCPGENLGRMLVFIFVTAVIQRFTLRPPPPGEVFDLDATPGNQRRLRKCVLCAELRD